VVVGAHPEDDERIGSFSFVFGTDLWEWSANAYRIYGYPSGAPASGDTDSHPFTTERVLGYVHPSDRDQLSAKLLDTVSRPTSLSSRHRLLDVDGRERVVILVATPLRDEAGVIVGLQGFFIECGAQSELEIATQQRIAEELGMVIQRREQIEQAKGMLMAIYGLNAEAAYRFLRGWSQTSNTAMQDLAEYVVTEFAQLGRSAELPSRSAYLQAIQGGTSGADKAESTRDDYMGGASV
jgi:hypothetical protein